MIRHGSPYIILGTCLALLISTLVFLFTQSLAFALGAAVVGLAICAYLGNRWAVAYTPAGPTPFMSRSSGFVPSTLFYITVGALTDVWSGVWYEYMRGYPPVHAWPWYVCYGLLLTGAVLLLIGLTLGRIGRAARQAELPPREVTAQVAQAEQRRASRA
jgi:hypothetical protein